MKMNTYEKYEQDCKKVRSVNGKLLDEFEAWLAKKKLSRKTIKEHSSNADFYY